MKLPGKRYNDETNGQIEMLLSCGIPPRKIAADLNIDPSLVYRRRSRLQQFGTVNPPPLSVQGRPRTLNREHEEAIEDFLDEYPQAYLDEVTAFLYDEFGLNVHKSTLSRALSRIRLTYKRVEPVSGAQDEDLRVSWMATISQYEAEHLVFVDETACNLWPHTQSTLGMVPTRFSLQSQTAWHQFQEMEHPAGAIGGGLCRH